jgi:PAS domain-containing protein
MKRLLDAFGDQVVIAVKNARLYEQLLREEKETARLYQSVLEKSNELEAILRGIGDGVIVIDPQFRLLMMNPVAIKIFRVARVLKPGVRLPEIVSTDALLALAQDTLTGANAPLIREISLEGADDRPEIYQALASAVRGSEYPSARRSHGVTRHHQPKRAGTDEIQLSFGGFARASHPLHSIKGLWILS